MNPIVNMAWRNVWRNPRRSILTMAALAFCSVLLIFMLSWQNGSYESMIRSAVSLTTGEVQVLAEGYHGKPAMRKVVERPQALLEKLNGLPDLHAVTLRSEAFCLVSSDSRSSGAMIVGVDPRQDILISNLEATVREGRYFAEDPLTALVGRKLAEKLKCGVGDELVVLGQGRDGSVAATVLTIIGLFESGHTEADRTLIRIPLAAFEETFLMRGAVHRVVIQSQSFSDPHGLKQRVMAELGESDGALEVLTWDELLPGLKESIELDLISAVIIYAFLMLVVAFSIMNTFLMAVLERTREFGTLMAIGASTWRLQKLLLLETLFLAVMGVTVGLLLGIGLTAWVGQVGIGFEEAGEMFAEFGMPSRIYPKMNALTVFVGPVFVVLVTFLAAAYPILKLMTMKPAQAMKAV